MSRRAPPVAAWAVRLALAKEAANLFVHELVIVDANAELADGQALDMMHGAPAIADQVIRLDSRVEQSSSKGPFSAVETIRSAGW